MGERRKPEDYRLRWRCAREIKDALREFGGPQRVGDPDLHAGVRKTESGMAIVGPSSQEN